MAKYTIPVYDAGYKLRASLTPRECDVLFFTLRGCDRDRISWFLKISLDVVKKNTSAVLKKFKCANASQLIALFVSAASKSVIQNTIATVLAKKENGIYIDTQDKYTVKYKKNWESKQVQISFRCLQTLLAILNGKSNIEIAKELGIDTETVKDNVSTLLRAFEVSSRQEIMALFVSKRVLKTLKDLWRIHNGISVTNTL